MNNFNSSGTLYLRKDASVKALERQVRDLQRRLAQRDMDLERAELERERSLAAFAHELRNPLSTVSNALQVLRLRSFGAKTDEVCQRALAAAERQVRRQTALVDDLLDAATVARGQVDLHLEPLDLAHLVREVVAAHRDDLRQAGIGLEAVLPEDGLSMLGDSARLWQALSHLLRNAGKFNHPGCTVRVHLRRDGMGRAEIRIVDDGDGIAADLLPHVFELFTQGEQGLDRAQGGLGVGLAVVKSLIELHGGIVEARSEGVPGKGVEIILRLPLAASGDAGNATALHGRLRTAAGRNAA